MRDIYRKKIIDDYKLFIINGNERDDVYIKSKISDRLICLCQINYFEDSVDTLTVHPYYNVHREIKDVDHFDGLMTSIIVEYNLT